MKTRLLLIFSTTLFFLLSCSVINRIPSPAIDVYTLSPRIESNQVSTKVKDAVILALSPLRSSRSLMGTDIIYRNSDYSYDSYSYSRWSDSPAQLLELFLQHYLASNQFISAVVPVNSAIKADVILEGMLLDFSHHIQNDGLSTGRVAIQFNLINNQSKKVLATKEFSAEVVTESINAAGATAAINQATKKVTEELNDWLLIQLAKYSRV